MGVKRWLRREIGIWRGTEIRPRIQRKCAIKTYGTGTGAWTVCPADIKPGSVIYSVGIGRNISFDLTLIDRHGVEVHAFDPTPRALEWLKSQELPPQFKVHPYGLASFDGEIAFNPPHRESGISFSIMERLENKGGEVVLPVHRLATLMRMLGHEQISVLKIDIEGAEYDVIKDLVAQRIPIGQILVEYHHHRFANVGVQHTVESIRLLNEAGYQIFAVSAPGTEYSFIKS